MSKLLMISADSHGAVNPADYAAWLDPKYRDQVDDLIKHTQFITDNVWVAAPDEQAVKGPLEPASFDPDGDLLAWITELQMAIGWASRGKPS